MADILNVHLGPGAWREYGAGPQEGSSFEEAIAAALRPHMHEVMVGVKALNGQLDLDVVVRLGNQYGIIEAKAGENGRKLDGIKQLNNAGRHLGTYVQQFYVITVEHNELHEALIAASRIRVISLQGYCTGNRELTEGDAQQIVSAVGKALQG